MSVRHLSFAVINPDKKSADFKATRLEKFKPSGAAPKLSTAQTCGIFALLVFAAAVVVTIVLLNDMATSSPTPSPITSAMTTLVTTVSPTPPPTIETPAPPGLGSSGAPLVVVDFVCNHALHGVDEGFCWALFSYNTSQSAIVPIGADNYLVHGPLSEDHPTVFTGARYGAVRTRWPCGSESSVSWVLRSPGGVSVATAPAAHHSCPPIPLPL